MLLPEAGLTRDLRHIALGENQIKMLFGEHPLAIQWFRLCAPQQAGQIQSLVGGIQIL